MKNNIDKISKVAVGTVKDTMGTFKEIIKYIQIIIAIPILALLLDFVLGFIFNFLKIKGSLSIFISIAAIVQVFFIIIRIGFKRFSKDTYINKVFAILFGFTAYWSLLFQIAFIFTLYYFEVGSKILPMDKINNQIMMFQANESIDLLFWVRIILNYVFPNFYKFPAVEGIAATCQFFLGKFIDLFILAFIVERLKKKIN